MGLEGISLIKKKNSTELKLMKQFMDVGTIKMFSYSTSHFWSYNFFPTQVKERGFNAKVKKSTPATRIRTRNMVFQFLGNPTGQIINKFRVFVDS